MIDKLGIATKPKVRLRLTTSQLCCSMNRTQWCNPGCNRVALRETVSSLQLLPRSNGNDYRMWNGQAHPLQNGHMIISELQFATIPFSKVKSLMAKRLTLYVFPVSTWMTPRLFVDTPRS